MTGLMSHHAQLKRATKDLWLRWSSTKEHWRDENCRQFEKNYLVRIRSELRRGEQALEHMDGLLSHVRSDCR